MDDLISRQAVLDMLEDINNHVIDGYGYRHDWCVEWVKGLPSIDAVQVARCKDCIYNPKKDEHTTQCPCSTTGDPFLDWIPDDNWFCADGEREES